MNTAVKTPAPENEPPQSKPLVAGDVMTRDDFLRRWEAQPNLKRAELIRGVVYMPSPLSLEHGSMESCVSYCLCSYRLATPGCRTGNNATWLMQDDAPQPDSSLFIMPEYGGRMQMRGKLAAGAPELLAEVCLASTSYDLHQKLDLYQEAGVQEYVAVLLSKNEVRWHRLTNGRFLVQAPPADNIYRSQAFPGLWIDAPALLAENLPRLNEVLNQGINSPEHAAFVAQLAAQFRAKPQRRKKRKE